MLKKGDCMKKYLLFILIFMLIPTFVYADDCSGITPDEAVKGQTGLTSLQDEYNTWDSTGNNGKACIKVIAIQNGNTRNYLSGKNPSNNYKCTDGSQAIAEFIATSLPEDDAKTECASETCYIPEIWLMDCGGATSSGSTNADNTQNVGNNSNNNSEDVSTNNNGQITGTTDSSETGVETYFVVLFILSVISYLVLIVSKKNNLFKNI